ncbi:hypothetical protein M408DRAFT_110836 [Serendipita vermifera MAFF 305830]|uniref:Uncharacterized protein n=1 Tax=Serendipita vermifera MAFF 305830 TaxID=933852 RepID=A0A0C3APL6_SERVB|nr:hypothetical protein M408DRAFT_110836 [Serendipita vermifera MAFF 305830]
MGSDSDTGIDRDNLSSISTILGLTLFCLLIVTICVRRWMIHRQNRRFARERFDAAATIVSHGQRRGGSEGTENDEPRTIAIGARAALLRQPIIWENHLSSPDLLQTSEKRSRGSCWEHLQPTALQLLSPHTTAHFPKRSTPTTRPAGSQSRIARAYSHFLFHRDHANTPTAPPPNTPNADLQPPTATAAPVLALATPRASSSVRAERRVSQTSSVPRRHSSATSRADVVDEAEKDDQEDGTYPHPVHLTFLISMPSASSPSYSTHQSSSHIPSTYLALGTTRPTARLPSILLKQDELDSWWDLPTPSYSPFPNTNNARFYTSPTAGLTAGQMLQLEVERERAEREAQRVRILQVGLGGGGSGGAGGGGGMGYGEYVTLARAVRR